MTGDVSKPAGVFSRWVDHFCDGIFKTTRRGDARVPSEHFYKRYHRRWRRLHRKRMLHEAIEDYRWHG